METTQDYLPKSLIPRALPEQMVVCVLSFDGGIIFDSIKRASEVSCPNCHGTDGYYNPGWKAWGCCQKECFQNNDYKKIEQHYGDEKKRQEHLDKYKPKIAEMKIFEVPLDCNNACFQNSDQSAKRKNFLSAWARKPEGFLLFQGGTGRGKTYTACAVLDSYRKTGKSSARFVNVSDLYIKWKDCFTSQVSEMQLIDRLIDQEILIVDDLGQRTPSEGFMEFLYIVLNKRSNNQHGTIVITNLSSTSLQVKFGDAIFSRVCSGEIIVFEGPDKRNKYSKN